MPPRLTGTQALERFTLARAGLDAARVSRLADRLDVDLSRRFADLSKGTKQKVGLVLAFAPRARLLVLDEPTSGLDPLVQRVFATLLSEAVADGATVLLSSHVMSEVEQVASRVALMREGRVAVVDDLAGITARARRRGRVRPRDAHDRAALQSALAATTGVSDVVVDDDSIGFACSGDMSPAMQALLGGSNLTSPVGYLNTQLFAFVLPAVLLVFGIGRGAAALAGEEEDRTLDLLLAQPVQRWSAYLQKAAAVAVSLTTLTAAVWIVLAAVNSPVRFDLPPTRLAASCVQMGLFALALSLAAQAISAATGRRSIGLSVTAGYAVVSYIVYGLSDTVGWLRALRPLTLWRWYLANDPLTSGLGWPEIAVLSGVCLLAAAGGVYSFGRRDLHA